MTILFIKYDKVIFDASTGYLNCRYLHGANNGSLVLWTTDHRDKVVPDQIAYDTELAIGASDIRAYVTVDGPSGVAYLTVLNNGNEPRSIRPLIQSHDQWHKLDMNTRGHNPVAFCGLVDHRELTMGKDMRVLTNATAFNASGDTSLFPQARLADYIYQPDLRGKIVTLSSKERHPYTVVNNLRDEYLQGHLDCGQIVEILKLGSEYTKYPAAFKTFKMTNVASAETLGLVEPSEKDTPSWVDALSTPISQLSHDYDPDSWVVEEMRKIVTLSDNLEERKLALTRLSKIDKITEPTLLLREINLLRSLDHQLAILVGRSQL